MSRERTAWLLFAGILAMKLALLVWLGPLIGPDTSGYVAYAREMAAGPQWRTAIDWKSAATPAISYRMAGFPALIYAAQTLAGAHWQWLLVAFQGIVAAYATARLFCLLDRIVEVRWLAVGLALAQASGINLAFDQFVLTDALNLSLLMLATIAVFEIARGDRVSPGRLALIAGGFLGSFLMREATATLMWVWVPLMVVAFWRAVPGWSAAALAVAVLVPTLVAKQAYTAWNLARGGERFVTTSYQAVLPQPLVMAYRFERRVFAGDGEVDRTAREVIKVHHFDEIMQLNHELFARHGWTAPQIMREMERRFWGSFAAYPAALLRGLWERQRFNYAFGAVAPVSSVNFLLSISGATEKNPVSFQTLSRRIFREGRLQFLPVLLADVAGRLVSIGLMLGLVVGLGALVMRGRQVWSVPLAAEALAAAALVGGFYMAHAIVHLEERYLMPMVPIVLIVAAVVLKHAGTLGLPVLNRLVADKTRALTPT